MEQSEEERVSSETMFAAEEPLTLISDWMNEAWAAKERDSNAMALASVDADGRPNVRMVLAKQIDLKGIVFYTNFESQKGGELQANPCASICFYWKTLRRQVRARGAIEKGTTAEADAYYASRDRESQIGAWASQQSRPLKDRAEFEQEIARVAAQFGEGDIPRPPHWAGFRLVPTEVEFWHERDFRLHDRLVFTRAKLGNPWVKTRLFP